MHFLHKRICEMGWAGWAWGRWVSLEGDLTFRQLRLVLKNLLPNLSPGNDPLNECPSLRPYPYPQRTIHSMSVLPLGPTYPQGTAHFTEKRECPSLHPHRPLGRPTHRSRCPSPPYEPALLAGSTHPSSQESALLLALLQFPSSPRASPAAGSPQPRTSKMWLVRDWAPVLVPQIFIRGH